MLRLSVLLISLAALAPRALGLAFSDESLLPHNGEVSQPYTFQIKGRAGSIPYTYTIDSGTLPPGLIMTQRGLISGVPTTKGSFSFWCNLRDAGGRSSQRPIKIDIADAHSPPPAAGPRNWVKPGWDLTFFDEFDAKELDPHRWVARYRGNAKWPANFVIKDGILRLRMDRDAPPVREDKLGRVSSIETGGAMNQFAQQYGLFEVRARGVRGSGLCVNAVLLPVDQLYKKLKSDGGTRASPDEARSINVFEQFGKDVNTSDFGVRHGGAGAGDLEETQHVKLPADLAADFHVYALQWSPDSLIWSVDGKEVHRSNKSARSAFIICLNLFESEQLGKAPIDPSVPFPRNFEVDYVRAYSMPSRQ